jgi:hypothetical protein
MPFFIHDAILEQFCYKNTIIYLKPVVFASRKLSETKKEYFATSRSY